MYVVCPAISGWSFHETFSLLLKDTRARSHEIYYRRTFSRLICVVVGVRDSNGKRELATERERERENFLSLNYVCPGTIYMREFSCTTYQHRPYRYIEETLYHSYHLHMYACTFFSGQGQLSQRVPTLAIESCDKG